MLRRLAALALLIPLFAGPVHAHGTAKGPISVEHPWSRPTPPNAKTGVVYLGLASKSADRLLGGASPMAERVELHRHDMEGNIARMRQVDAVEVKAGTTVTLQPGGLHIMLIGLKEPLRAGTRFPMTLHFENAGEVRIVVSVETARPSSTDHKH